MSITINWFAMTKQQRSALIAEHVMDQRLHVEFAQGSETEIDLAVCVDDPGGVTRIEVIPDYVGSIDAAWLIIEKLGIPTTLNYTPGFAPQEPDGQSAHYECKLIELDILGGNDKIARAIANTPAEAICVAALRWMGIQVTHTIEAIPCWEVTFEDGETLICKNKHDAEQILSQREQYLKNNLQWAVNIRKLKIAEVMVPEDYFNGPVIG